LIVSAGDATDARQTALWGFDATRTNVPVLEVLDRAHLDYATLLDVVNVRWIDNASTGDGLAIERPGSTCALDKQTITHFTVSRFDRAHRFLRLRQRTGWKMWELDRLLRAPAVGAGVLDAGALVRLRELRKVQKALSLS